MTNYVFIGGLLNHEIHPTDDSYNWLTHKLNALPKASTFSDDLTVSADYETHNYIKEQIVFGSTHCRYFYRHESLSTEEASEQFSKLMVALLDKYVEVNYNGF